MASKAEMQGFAIQTARNADINPDYFVNQIEQESGFNPQAYNSASGASGIAQIIPYWHPGIDVWNWQEALAYAAELDASYLRTSKGSYPHAMAAYNWGSGNVFGYTKANGQVVPPWDGTRASLPDETAHYLDVILGSTWSGGTVAQNVTIGPEVPASVVRQTDDWSCSVRASYAALWILSKIKGEDAPLYAWWAQQMAPYADSSVGLKDASGAGLATALRSVGVKAVQWGSPSREEVAQYIRDGKLVLIGGRQWGPAGHWALVRGVEPDGTLMLANPAGCYALGGTPICDQLLSSWSKSFWSAVVVEVPQAKPEPEIPADPCAERVKELERQLAEARNLVGNAYNLDGTVRKALAALVQQTYAIDSWLEANRS